MNESPDVYRATEQWLQEVVIGLNLCPFARRPSEDGLIRIHVCHAQDEATLLEGLLEQFHGLAATPPAELETTLVVVPNFLSDFMDYNQFLDWVDLMLQEHNWHGVFQVATFHPQYYFSGPASEDAENLTNRAPYPIFHLIREASLEKAIEHYPNPEGIPDKNIAKMKGLSEQDKQKLFYYLYQH